MRYAVWFVRLVFVAWMFPAGLNHFVPLFPQPLGNQPLSRELFAALADSRLFDIVKAVELVAGLSVLTGFHVPLALLLCMPVSFCVWYWDVPLQGWGSISAIYGWAVLLANIFLCLTYIDSYRALLAPRSRPQSPGGREGLDKLFFIARLIFGGWMLASGLNFFLGPLFPLPGGHEPLAVQLMTALVHSQLLDVAMAIQFVTGALILAGLFIPLALCIVMPISVCAAYWAVVLEHEPVGAILALAAMALNGLLMLRYLDDYQGMLRRHARALGETEPHQSYESLYVDASGRTSRAHFIGALVPLLAAAALYHLLVPGLTGHWCLIVLLFPAIILHVRRLHDMGRPAWLLLLPVLPIAVAIWLFMAGRGSGILPAISLAVIILAAGFTLWGLLGRNQTGSGQPGEAVA